jgi:hypothetical protein
MTFLNALEKELNVTETWNGAKAYSSTLNANLDLFGKIGASRNNISQAVTLFNAAYAENPETATRILFYGRDIRGGQGERSVFKALFKELVITNSVIGRKLVPLVPFYGRWDDLLVLEETKAWIDAMALITSQLSADMASLRAPDKSISLLAKWLPSVNASNKDTVRLGKKIAKELDITEKEYRKLLVSLRAKIKIVEQSMCSGKWDEINYEHLPSRAALMYRKAFKKHDETRYAEYIEAVQAGKKTINASTLYPYDIAIAVAGSSYYDQKAISELERNALDAQWKALPNYMEGKEFNGLVLADVSGSMYSAYSGKTRPIDVSISLATYIAERNTGVWKDTFLAFESEPKLVKLAGNDIYAKLQGVKTSTRHMGSTNLIGAIKAILDTGTKNGLTQDEMPQSLIVISDMQFNQACSCNRITNFEQMQRLYSQAGYEMPSVIFWNVNSASNVPMTVDDTGTALVSGCSPSILKAVLARRIVSPLDLMNGAIYTERYDAVGKVFA